MIEPQETDIHRETQHRDIIGLGNIEPTQPAGDSFRVECDIRFTVTFPTQASGLPTTARVHCHRCIVRRADSKPTPDGDYTLHIDRGGTTDMIKLRCLNGGWQSVD